jgi:acyl dehydratase
MQYSACDSFPFPSGRAITLVDHRDVKLQYNAYAVLAEERFGIRAEICYCAPMRYFEDFSEGQVFELGERRVSEREIVDFARDFDPQPFHVDPEQARHSIYGGLIASGWHTGSIYMSLLVRGLLHDAASLGSAGIDEMRWLKPVRPGDVLEARMTVTSLKPSQKHPDRGTVFTLGELFNQGGERVMFVRSSGMFSRRATSPSSP